MTDVTVDEDGRRACPECGKLFNPAGWGAHRRAAHGIAGQPRRATLDRSKKPGPARAGVECDVCVAEGRQKIVFAAQYIVTHRRRIHGLRGKRPAVQTGPLAEWVRPDEIEVHSQSKVVQSHINRLTEALNSHNIRFTIATDKIFLYGSDGSLWAADRVSK